MLLLLHAPNGWCYFRSRKRWSSCPSLNHSTYVPIGPPNPAFAHKRILLRRMFFFNEDRPTTCLSVSTLHAIFNTWWISEPLEGAGPSPSFSPTNKWPRWRIVCLLYAIPCVTAGTVSSSSARVATLVYTPQGSTGLPECLSTRNT